MGSKRYFPVHRVRMRLATFQSEFQILFRSALASYLTYLIHNLAFFSHSRVMRPMSASFGNLLRKMSSQINASTCSFEDDL